MYPRINFYNSQTPEEKQKLFIKNKKYILQT